MNYNKYFPIIEYYKKVVQPIDPVRYKVKSDKMFVCPLHDDHDPSLGLIQSKNGDIVHCFGCNFWGDILSFHKTLQKRQFKKSISEDDALRDLCRIFNVKYEEVPKPEGSKGRNDGGAGNEIAVNNAIECFDVGDFYRLIQEGKREKKSIGYFNAVVMTMLDSVRE